ncbi:MAG: hypothetical protein NTW18_00665 [Candidatus Omnitrophica bacterium]|nr:hypothetical protein [Candidatus Omnitrophota bacterium]
MRNENIRTLTFKDFEDLFKDTLSDFVREKIGEYSLKYYDITDAERDTCIKKIVAALIGKNLIKAGEHRFEQWEVGWKENLKNVIESQDIDSIIPNYFGKYDYVRINRKFVKPASKDFEYRTLCVIVDWLFDKYIREVDTIYEFGCGTGYHLLRAREVNLTATLWGLDWAPASQEIINQLSSKGIDSKLYAHRFDYFNPDTDFSLDKNSVVYTVASLEQIGSKFKKFVNYLIKNKPKFCIHVEPISELLDENDLIDYLSIEYFKKRNYLSGFLTYLRNLEKKSQIKILKAQRTFVGSLFIEGYSLVVWTPCI